MASVSLKTWTRDLVLGIYGCSTSGFDLLGQVLEVGLVLRQTDVRCRLLVVVPKLVVRVNL